MLDRQTDMNIWDHARSIIEGEYDRIEELAGDNETS